MSRCSFIGETSTSDCPAPVSASWRRLSTAGGADLVIGSHPHVVQPAETIEDSAGNVRGATVYSMGNFVSNQRFPDTDGGLSVRVTLTLDEQGRTSCRPEYLIVWTCISRDPNSASGRRYDIVPSYSRETVAPRASRRFRPVRRAYAPAHGASRPRLYGDTMRLLMRRFWRIGGHGMRAAVSVSGGRAGRLRFGGTR